MPLFLALLLAASVPPQAVQAARPSAYHVVPAMDVPVIAAAALGIAIPYAFAGKLIHPRCPCDPGEVNALDRHVIGNQNKFLDDTSDATAGVVGRSLDPRRAGRRPVRHLGRGRDGLRG